MKILIAADVHLYNYYHYNYTSGSRIKQFDTLADRIIELAKLNSCDTLILAGDTVDVPTLSPEVLNTLSKFINKLKSGFSKIYYILGQHDLATKSVTQNDTDTPLTIFNDDAFIYANHIIEEIDGARIGFMNWTPTQNTDWIDGKLDLLIAHYTKSVFAGKDELDEGKFDIMIHGDIHNDQVIGKFVSVGNPIQKDMSSLADGSMIIYDTKTKSYERIRTDEDHSRFLRMIYTKDINGTGFKDPLTYMIYQPDKIQIQEKSNGDDGSSFDVSELDSIILAQSKAIGLEDINERCNTSMSPVQDIDFNFQLNWVDIVGYRSIHNLHLDFKSGDRVIIVGRNGSGKSSIMRPIKYLFVKNRFLDDQRSLDSDFMQLSASITYQDKTYIIKKGKEWGLRLDGHEPKPYNNKTQFEDDLYEVFPFLNYAADLMFIDSTTPNLSAQLSDDRRIDLISKFYKLDKLQALSETSLLRNSELLADIDDLNKKLSPLTVTKQYVAEQIAIVEDKLKGYNLGDITIELDSILSKQKMSKEYSEWIKSLESTKIKIENTKSRISDLSTVLEDGVDKYTNKLSDIETNITLLNTELSQVDDDWKSWIKISKEKSDAVTEGAKARADYDLASNSKCPVCSNPLSDHSIIESYKAELQRAIDKYETLNTRYLELCHTLPNSNRVDEFYYENKVSKLNTKIKDYYNDKVSIQVSINDYNKAVKDKLSLEDELIKHEEYLSKLNGMKMDEVVIDESVLLRLSELTTIKSQFDQLSELNNNHKSISEKITELSNILTPKVNEADRYLEYSQLTSRTGKVMEIVLTKLARSFSSDKFVYSVDAGKYRSNDRIQFKSDMVVKGRNISYKSLSDGQKLLADLDFLNLLFNSKVGLFAPDELLKFVDDDNVMPASEAVDKLNVNTVVLSTNNTNYPKYTKKYLVELMDDGKSSVSQY